MNYKLLFPSYRTRYKFIRKCINKYTDHIWSKTLNLGTGEGDYDPMIANRSKTLIGCDINESDIRFAEALNADIKNVSYQVENALDLSFENEVFDLVISVDVLEHVGQPERMVKEISRVLKKEGLAFISFPQYHFPYTYDPVNALLKIFQKKKVSIGAYGYGHEYLIHPEQFKTWARNNHLEIIHEQNLSGYLVGLTEMYWPGLLQKMLKANSTNLSDHNESQMKLRPSTKEPILAKLTDGWIYLDHLLFKQSKYSIGKGFILRKMID